MKSEPIPLEIAIPEDAPLPNLSPSDVYHFLATKVKRGHFICYSLFLVLAVTSGVGFIVHQTPLAIASFVLAIVFGSCAYIFQRKLALARRISVEPSLVYWAHPTILRQRLGGHTIDTTFITLHSRSGTSFEVAMLRNEMFSLVVWLRAHNPDIRLGSYDNTASTPNNHDA